MLRNEFDEESTLGGDLNRAADMLERLARRPTIETYNSLAETCDARLSEVIELEQRIDELEKAYKVMLTTFQEQVDKIDELERLLRMAKSVYREDTSSDIQWENAKTKALHPQEQKDDPTNPRPTEPTARCSHTSVYETP